MGVCDVTEGSSHASKLDCSLSKLDIGRTPCDLRMMLEESCNVTHRDPRTDNRGRQRGAEGRRR
jgi:hypothetical protein